MVLPIEAQLIAAQFNTVETLLLILAEQSSEIKSDMAIRRAKTSIQKVCDHALREQSIDFLLCSL